MSGGLTLILGGVRSGKSTRAEQLAAAGGRVLFGATAEARDEEMRRRIAAHRAARPSHWDTLEEPLDLAGALRPVHHRYDTILLDCLTLWVSNLLLDRPPAAPAEDRHEEFILQAARELLGLAADSGAAWIVVSNEVGLGVVPPTPLGRAYRDTLGRVNQLVAAQASAVYLMVAGLSLQVKPPVQGHRDGSAPRHHGEHAVDVAAVWPPASPGRTNDCADGGRR